MSNQARRAGAPQPGGPVRCQRTGKEAPIFYLVFTAVYGLMHWLVFAQAARALGLQGLPRWLLLAWCAAMTLAPAVTGHAGERTGLVAEVTFIWMGLVFYLFLGSLLLAAVKPLAGPAVHRALFFVVAGLGIAICAYGFVNARDIRVRELVLRTDRLPPGVERVRLAVISDLHLYSVEQGVRLDRVLPVLESLDYDALLSLGDLIEAGAHRGDWEVSAARLARLTPRLGKYAVNGNHETYADRVAGGDFSAGFHREAGFELLSGRVADAGGALWIAGVDYPGHAEATGGRAIGEAEVLHGLPRDRPIVLLKHLPEPDPEALGLFDLQLSGHTHAGQLWPFHYLVRTRLPYMQGLFELEGGARLYVSEGTGTWGPPMRVGTTPEITLVTLERDGAGAAGR